MGRRTLQLLLVGAVMAALAVLPGTAFGGKPLDQFHDHITDSFSDEICGIPVDVDLVVTDNFFDYGDEGFKDTTSGQFTYTNPVNGKAVDVSGAGQVTGIATVDEEAGTITLVTTAKGLTDKVSGDHGAVLLRDAGIITLVNTFDLETGELISSEVIVEAGPHPNAESDFILFCEVVSEALA